MTDQDVRRRRRRKVMEWTRRYLPCEIAGWVGELSGAAIAYWLTESLAVSAVAATVGSSIGYYIPAYVNAMRWSIVERRGSWSSRVIATNLFAMRSLTVEFGIAEVIDSFLVRPALYYMTPILLGHVVWGWVLGGFVADVVFYAFTIFSYERFGRWLAHRPGLGREAAAETLVEAIA